MSIGKIIELTPGACDTVDRLRRIETILLGLEWAGVSVENVSEAGGDVVYLRTDRFCLLCGGYSTEPSQVTIPGQGHRGHRADCLFRVELPR